jgi:iron complex outermembrane receptor protein
LGGEPASDCHFDLETFVNAKSRIKQPARLALVCVLTVLQVNAAFAQRAAQNAVTQADDAFGSSVGNEQIGLYSSFDVRGFSPTTAGNIRIDGLYFDQVAELNSRLVESSRIRVGIAAQGYAFPAPTGVVDYSLRTPGNEAHLSSLAEINSRGTASLEFDGAAPLLDNVLSVQAGVGFVRDVLAEGSSSYQHSEGASMRWTPTPDIEVTPFWSRLDIYDNLVGQVYVPNGAFLPRPMPGRHFFGPDWAANQEFDVNYGGLARVNLADGWDVRAGIFRSEFKQPKHKFILLGDLNPAGMGDLRVFSDPPAGSRSTSGELRLEHSMEEGARVHRAILSLRMRDWNGTNGGADLADLGPVAIGQRVDAPEPEFHYSDQIRDHASQLTLGFTYQMAWKNIGELGLGIQKASYRKRTLVPGQAPVQSNSTPWLFNAALTGIVSETIAVFGSYTRGLEESGIAPQTAANRNQALPAIATRQEDMGLRWTITPDMKLVSTLFEIEKPYFSLDAGNVFRQLGQTQNRGVEISLSGNITPQLDIVAGGVFSQPRVTGEAVRLGTVGGRPVGIASRKLDFHLNWRPPDADNLSFGFGVTHTGRVPATLDNRVFLPDWTTMDTDARYNFALDGQPASLRFSIVNILGTRAFDLNDAGAYNIHWNSGRRYGVRLIVDL